MISSQKQPKNNYDIIICKRKCRFTKGAIKNIGGQYDKAGFSL